MATNTKIADVIVPEVFQKYMLRETAEKSRVFNAGIMTSNPAIAGFLAGGGRTVNLPFWTDLYTGSTTDNISGDDETVIATTQKFTTQRDLAIRHSRNQSWSSSDLVAALAGDDPLKLIAQRVGTYWANQFDKMTVSVLRGLVADNIAANSGDMVKDSTGSTITADLVIDAAATMGDADDRLACIIMHSKTYARLAKLNLIDFIPDSDGHVKFPTYLGFNVIRDDDCYQNGTITHTYLVARDAFAWGEGTPKYPVETRREPLQANGGGVEIIVTRKEFVLHPYGYQWAIATPGAGMVGQSPTDAEMLAATAWTRIAPRKNVGLAALITNL